MSILDTLDRNMPILVVDDYPSMRRIVKNCLRQLGFENVTEAEDGKIALEKLNVEEFKFIISDYSMPEMDGVDLLRTLRAHDRTKAVPFLMVTPEVQKEALTPIEELPFSCLI